MLKLKEGIDYHIKEVGKCLELTSMSLAGYTAGVIELTRRSFEINQGAVTNIGMMLMAKTIPKVPKPKPKAKPKPVVDKPVVAKKPVPVKRTNRQR